MLFEPYYFSSDLQIKYIFSFHNFLFKTLITQQPHLVHEILIIFWVDDCLNNENKSQQCFFPLDQILVQQKIIQDFLWMILGEEFKKNRMECRTLSVM